MKKMLVLMSFLAILLAGCVQKSVSSNESRKSNEITTDTSSTIKSKESTNDSTTDEKRSIDISEVSTTVKNTESTMESSSQPEKDNSLEGYSDDQIEYARVWLATMGTTYKKDLEDPNTGFELHVRKESAGYPVNPYAEDSVTFPEDTVILSAKYAYQSLVVYSSNYDGTITKYPVPGHFQNQEENTREGSQKILDGATIVSIPTSNPEDVKELINVMHIDN